MGILSHTFINVQLLIFFSIVISSIIGGKKLSLLAVAVWAIETVIIYNNNRFNYIQVITVVFAFQIGLILGIVRDGIVKRLNKKKQRLENN